MTNEPFYNTDGERYFPTEYCAGPWDPKSLNGRVIAGLLGAEIERLYGEPDFVPARLTVDMYRLPDHSPVEVIVRPVREGRRIKVIDAEFISGGKSAARATCQLLRRTDNPTGKVWSAPTWDVPKPADLPPPQDWRAGMGGKWAMRRITGDFGVIAQRRAWINEIRELVAGRALTPFVRIAGCVDFTSPFANGGDSGLQFINSDVTLYLHRVPRSEWVGIEVINHQSSDGVAIAECRIYDEEGPIGASSCCALGQKISPTGPTEKKA